MQFNYKTHIHCPIPPLDELVEGDKLICSNDYELDYIGKDDWTDKDIYEAICPKEVSKECEFLKLWRELTIKSNQAVLDYQKK